jgi:hypothetical protein
MNTENTEAAASLAVKEDHSHGDEPAAIVVGETRDHTGIACPFCGINGACGHPVRLPPIPAWQPNVWFRGP